MPVTYIWFDIREPLIQGFQQLYEEYNSAEAIEQRRPEQLEKEQSYNHLEDEFSINGVKYVSREDALHHTINEALEGKVKNASLYAAELDRLFVIPFRCLIKMLRNELRIEKWH